MCVNTIPTLFERDFAPNLVMLRRNQTGTSLLKATMSWIKQYPKDCQDTIEKRRIPLEKNYACSIIRFVPD